MVQKKPHLLISLLVEQPTWGGAYILQYKEIKEKSVQSLKIGQSYELYSGTQICSSSSTKSYCFSPAPPSYNKDTAFGPNSIATYVSQNPSSILGPRVFQKFGRMPLLIKFTQSFGNSFQLHVKKATPGARWAPKPESWYFFEDGLITFGIKKGVSVSDYKICCMALEKEINKLGELVRGNKQDITTARNTIQRLIKKYNPWQYVNVHEVQKDSSFDLSIGGIHHSWEHDVRPNSIGNVLYEVQTDSSDDISTLRSFDKGNISDKGTVRKLTIEDYFNNLDKDHNNNNVYNVINTKHNERLVHTPFFSLSKIVVNKKVQDYITDSFVHLFIKQGSVLVECTDGELILKRGQSCFVPYCTKNYTLTPISNSSIVLKTHIPVDL